LKLPDNFLFLQWPAAGSFLSRLRFMAGLLILCLFLSPIAVGQDSPEPQEDTASSEEAVSEEEKAEEEAEEKTEEKDQPSTREEQWRQKRMEKKTRLEPPKKPFWEKYLYNFDQKGNDSLEDANFFGFYPRLDWIARGSGIGAGVRYWKPNIISELDIMGAAFYSWRQYQFYELDIGFIPHRGKRIPPLSFREDDVDELADLSEKQRRFARFKLYGKVRYRDLTQQDFYGLGPDSDFDDLTNYRLKEAVLEGTTGFQFTEHLGWTLKAGGVWYDLGPGKDSSSPPTEGVFPPEEAPGIDDEPDYVRLRTYFVFDYRDDPQLPRKGFFLALGTDRMNNIGNTDMYNFNRYGLDARGYIPLGYETRVLALRGVFAYADPKAGNEVPFFLQPSLGGSRTLRGFANYRFTGNKAMLYQIEYRWFASSRIELALFVDTGTVALAGSSLSFSDLKTDGGVGFRLNTSQSTVFRLDVAHSNEGTYAHIRFSMGF